MILPFPITIFAFVLLGSTTVSNVDDSPAKLLQTWADTWESSDIDRMMKLYEASEKTIAIESLGHIRRGPSGIRKMYRGAFDQLKFDEVTVTPITQGQHESVAWVSFRYKAQIRMRSDNSKFVLETIGSFVMKNENGSWKITMEHFSTIPKVPRVRPANEK